MVRTVLYIHITGVCGTFMGGVAQLARSLGFEVTGSDANVYPPMDGQLQAAGIELMEGYSAANLSREPDLVIIGNALSRGNEEVEFILDRGFKYTSGAQWLSDYFLQGRWVVAVAGTHGKTTTSSMIAWILEYAGLAPGFLIGGVPANFGCSARAGDHPFFVVEADEYDTAFFDKRSKFVHYRPRTAVLNNLEFDHADIFEDLAAIKKQFHHLVRTIPANGKVITNQLDQNLAEVLEMGCWSDMETFGDEAEAKQHHWHYRQSPNQIITPDGVCLPLGQAEQLALQGVHNLTNAVAAIAAARHAGVPVSVSVEAMKQFKGVKRRLELLDTVNGIELYDDFAHHPTEIAATLSALKPKLLPGGRLYALLDFRSNSMVAGTHLESLSSALELADSALLHNAQPEKLDLSSLCRGICNPAQVFNTAVMMVEHLKGQVKPGDIVVCMSNGSFAGIYSQILTMLNE